MIKLLFNTIPKGSNEIFFFVSMVCAFLLIPRKDKRVFFLLSITAFMITWRVFVQIVSSRYSIAIIYPTVLLYSIFLTQSNFSRSKLPLIKFALLVLFGFIVVVFAIKGSSFSTTNCRIKDTVDFINYYSKKPDKVSFYVQSNEYNRLSFYTGNAMPITSITETNTLFYYVRECSSGTDFDCINRSTLQRKRFQATQDASQTVFSFPQSKKEKNYFILTKRSDPHLDSFYSFAESNNLLDNGDFEIAETREDYLRKSKRYLNQYTDSHDVSFARNAFFTFGTSSPVDEWDYFGITSLKTISGSSSARISTGNYTGYLFFYDHFDPGTYVLSFLTKATPGTDISPLVNINGSSQFFPTRFTICKKGLHQGTVGFIVRNCDFFLLGFAVDGDATIDNVVLRKIDTL